MKDHYSQRAVAEETAGYAGAFRARFSSHDGEGGRERCREKERRRASRVSGSVGRVTERFRVPLAPALTRLPDTVTSLIREYPPRAVSPFSLNSTRGPLDWKGNVRGANSTNRGKIAIPRRPPPRRDGSTQAAHRPRRLPADKQFRLHYLDSLLRTANDAPFPPPIAMVASLASNGSRESRAMRIQIAVSREID